MSCPPARGLVSPRKGAACRGHHPMGKMLRWLEVATVPQGVRSSFCDWAAECIETSHEVCELAPMLVNSDRVKAAYRRRDLFERRRPPHAVLGRLSARRHLLDASSVMTVRVDTGHQRLTRATCGVALLCCRRGNAELALPDRRPRRFPCTPQDEKRRVERPTACPNVW